jgi:hypothetical protein
MFAAHLHRVFAPGSREDIIALDTEVSVEHLRQIEIVFNDENLRLICQSFPQSRRTIFG